MTFFAFSDLTRSKSDLVKFGQARSLAKNGSFLDLILQGYLAPVESTQGKGACLLRAGGSGVTDRLP